MLGSDRRLDSKCSGATAQGLIYKRESFGDLLDVPAAAILLLEDDEIPGLIKPRIAA